MQNIILPLIYKILIISNYQLFLADRKTKAGCAIGRNGYIQFLGRAIKSFIGEMEAIPDIQEKMRLYDREPINNE